MTAWGVNFWGKAPWGGPGFGPVAALAIRENVIRLAFSEVVYASGLGDPEDAILSATYDVVESVDSIGYDGTNARPVKAVFANIPDESDGVPPIDVGRFVDVVLDRPMTPFPALYKITPNGVWNEAKTLPSGVATLDVEALYRELVQPTAVFVAGSRDLANAQFARGEPSEDTYPVGEDGDYAFDEGPTSYEKRIRRVVVTNLNGFAHLVGYGVGVKTYSKKIATSARVAQLITDTEEQIARDPETEQVKVRVVPSTQPGLQRLDIVARSRQTQRITRLSVPFNTR